MCVQVPDQVLIEDRNVAIDPLPLIANESITYKPDMTLQTTANARGYVTYWLLINQKLYLVETEGCYQMIAQNPVFADWVCETIVPAEGTYGETFAIEVENGRITEGASE